MNSRKKSNSNENTFRNTEKTPGVVIQEKKAEKESALKVMPVVPKMPSPKSYHVPSPNLKYNPPNPIKAPKRKITQHPVRIAPIDRFYSYPVEKELFSTAELAEIFEVTAKTVRNAIRDNNIFAYREGLYYQVPRKEVERMIIQRYWS